MKNIKLSFHNKWLMFYLIAGFASCFLFNQVISAYSTYTIFIAVVGIVAMVFYYFYERYMLKKERKPSMVVLSMIIGFLAMQCMYVIIGEMILCQFVDNKVQWFFSIICFALVIGIAVALYRMYRKEKINSEQLIGIVIFISFLWNLIYAHFTGVSNLSRQNDTIAFFNGGGHLGYIWHVWAYGNLPQVDPRSMWEFSQPPLYYLLCGYWVKISSLFGISSIRAAENIQMLSVFMVTATTIYTDKIMLRMRISIKKRLCGVLLLSAIPYMTYLSGAVNNDVLFVLLMVMVFYYVLRWYEEPKLYLLIITAVLTGLLVMTKSSGALVAPAILGLFIIRLIKIKEKRIRQILEYLLFGVISLPLGLWWNIRNMIRFDMPFLYVNEPSTESMQYIPDYSLWERIFDVKNQLNHLYTELSNANPNVDHNIIISTVKTLTFSQSYEMMSTDVTFFWGLLLFIFTTALVITMILFGVYGFLKGEVKTYYKITWFIFVVAYLIFYLRFNIQFPFVHTMHARYIMPIFILGIPWMMIGLEQVQKKISNITLKKVSKRVAIGCVVCYLGILQCYIIQILIQAADFI